MISNKFDPFSTVFQPITLSKNDFDRFINACQSDAPPCAALIDATQYLRLFRTAQLVLSEDDLSGLPVKSSSDKTGQQA